MTQNDINILRSKIYQVHIALDRLYYYLETNKEVVQWAIDNDLKNIQASDLVEMNSVLRDWAVEFDILFTH